MARYVVVTEGSAQDDMEAFGVFQTEAAAEKFRDEYEEEGCRPAFPLAVVELYTAGEGRRLVREERELNRG